MGLWLNFISTWKTVIRCRQAHSLFVMKQTCSSELFWKRLACMWIQQQTRYSLILSKLVGITPICRGRLSHVEWLSSSCVIGNTQMTKSHLIESHAWCHLSNHLIYLNFWTNIELDRRKFTGMLSQFAFKQFESGTRPNELSEASNVPEQELETSRRREYPLSPRL